MNSIRTQEIVGIILASDLFAKTMNEDFTKIHTLEPMKILKINNALMMFFDYLSIPTDTENDSQDDLRFYKTLLTQSRIRIPDDLKKIIQTYCNNPQKNNFLPLLNDYFKNIISIIETFLPYAIPVLILRNSIYSENIHIPKQSLSELQKIFEPICKNILLEFVNCSTPEHILDLKRTLMNDLASGIDAFFPQNKSEETTWKKPLLKELTKEIYASDTPTTTPSTTPEPSPKKEIPKKETPINYQQLGDSISQGLNLPSSSQRKIIPISQTNLQNTFTQKK